MKQSTAIVVKGSLQQSAGSRSVTFAEAFLSVEAILICDVSGSMSTKDVASESGPCSRWDEAGRQLTRLQARFPGRLAVVAFSDYAEFRPDGTLPPVQSSTNLLRALQFIQPASQCGIRFIVVSDGRPDDEASTLHYATSLKNKIDAIHVGNDASGRRFMEALAKASGGQSVEKNVLELESVVVKLLSA